MSNFEGLMTKILAILDKWWLNLYGDNQFGVFFNFLIFHKIDPKLADGFEKPVV
jgi:hypothetical protein